MTLGALGSQIANRVLLEAGVLVGMACWWEAAPLSCLGAS
jgi:hypothetical protein